MAHAICPKVTKIRSKETPLTPNYIIEISNLFVTGYYNFKYKIGKRGSTFEGALGKGSNKKWVEIEKKISVS